MEEKIFEALAAIKNVCKDCRSCSLCPFSGPSGKCIVTDKKPEDWEIRKKTKVMYLE